MKTKIIKGVGEQIRFETKPEFKIGDIYKNDFGEIVEVVGPGLAGMPEMKKLNGSTYLAMPHELTSIKNEEIDCQCYHVIYDQCPYCGQM